MDIEFFYLYYTENVSIADIFKVSNMLNISKYDLVVGIKRLMY